jgi:hypothetical protein
LIDTASPASGGSGDRPGHVDGLRRGTGLGVEAADEGLGAGGLSAARRAAAIRSWALRSADGHRRAGGPQVGQLGRARLIGFVSGHQG